MNFQKLLMIFVAAVGALTAFGQTVTTTSTRTVTLAPLGLGSTETAQVNLVNTASNTSTGTAASCTGTVSFVSATNTAIGAATSFTVLAGQVSSVTLPFSKAGLTGSRGVIRPAITITTTSGVPCSLEYSIETFDTSSGATHIYYSPQAVSVSSGQQFGR
jgi:hypothetical protein